MSINYIINITKVNQNRKKITLEALSEELKELSCFLEIIDISKLKVVFEVFKESNLTIVEGSIKADIIQQSSILDEKNILSNLNINFKRLFKLKDKARKKKLSKYIDIISLEEEIDIIDNININIKDILQEELILEIDPFIK